MRVLIDTSVWSLAFRRGGPADHPTVSTLTSLLESDDDVFLTGIVLQEVLQAFRTDAAFRTMVDRLRPFPLLGLDRSDRIRAATLHRRCAASGIAASTADCEIATAAIRHDCRLLTADRDFERIARVSDLRLV